MKKKLTIILSSLAIAGTLAVALPSVFAEANVAPTPMAEHHPAIRKAIDALEEAKADLKRADHDFGGHRAAALEECDRAIMQLREALKFDKD